MSGWSAGRWVGSGPSRFCGMPLPSHRSRSPLALRRSYASRHRWSCTASGRSTCTVRSPGLPSLEHRWKVHLMIDVRTSTSGLLVTITGDLDLATRDEAEAASRRIALRERPNLTVDLCRMSFMVSTGASWLTALVEQDRRLGGHPVLRGAGPRDLYVLEVCGVLDRVEVDSAHHCPHGGRAHATA